MVCACLCLIFSFVTECGTNSLDHLKLLSLTSSESIFLSDFKTGTTKSKTQKMTDTSDRPQIPSVVFGSSIDGMADPLRRLLNVTEEELTYLKTILTLRTKKRQPLAPERSGYGYPSIVIDDFLYHGDLGHASNIGLLNQLGIRHIVNVCDCSLDQMITEKFNVLWINVNDELQADIKKYFDETNQFLYNCKEKNEKVLVHCQMGISRSSSIVLAYLMK